MRTLIKHAILVLFLYAGTACTQPNAVNGVYAGVELTLSTMMGGGMNRNDVVILFRPDGTYNDDLGKPDWQTRVAGWYTVSGRTVSLRSNGDKRAIKYTIDKDGDLNAGSFNLIRQPLDSSIPKGYFEFSSASGSGGGSSGMVYVGSSSNMGLNFDGKGNFSNSSESATMVSGESVGGGSSRKKGGKGTYKINKGVLTLTYDNGTTQVHSFFCRPGYDPVMAVIDGDIYFMKKSKNATPGKSGGKTSSQAPVQSAAAGDRKAPAEAGTADAKSILLKANAAHGGTALDDVKSVSFVATVEGLQAYGFVDVAGKRVRIEVRQANKLIQVEQVEGQSGWQWRSGKVGALPKARLAEMSGTLGSGILGLRKSIINSATIKSMKQTQAGYAIIYEQAGQQHALVINKQLRMVASADQAGQAPTSSLYSDFRTVSGVLIPFVEVNTSGNQKVSVKYQKFEIKPTLPEHTWAKPAELP
jgi:hypothetical protein